MGLWVLYWETFRYCLNLNRFGVSATIHSLREMLNQRVDSQLVVEVEPVLLL